MLLALLSISLFIISSNSHAIQGTDRKFGAGMMVVSSTGFNFKHWHKKSEAMDFYLSFSDNKVEIHADYLLHKLNLIKISEEKLSLHYGAGLRVLNKDNGKDQVGVRVPVGVNYYIKDFDKIPVEIFVEIVPIFNFVTKTDLDIDTFFGVRYYF
jgi:hypothetical protein